MPWNTWLDNLRGKLPYNTREAAMNSFLKPYYRPGKAEVRDSRTGETWQRRRGSWFKTAEPHATARPQGLAGGRRPGGK